MQRSKRQFILSPIVFEGSKNGNEVKENVGKHEGAD